ncbi:MAG TPA: MFS transporter [Methylomirabilota bacterium]|nr:MFS transporter [Methylomirabilota bacterium]
MTTHAGTVAAFDARASLTRNILALTSGLTLWTAVHFGVTAILPLLLHDQGYDARGIGFMLGAMGMAQLALRPFAGWIVDAFGRRTPLVLSLVLLASASALLFSPVGWAVLANRVLTGAAYSLGTTAFFTLVVEAAPPGRHGEVQGYVALGITLGVGLGPVAAVALYQGFSPGTVPAERMTSVAIGAVTVAVSSGVCFSAVSSTFRARGRAHPYALRTNFRREGLLPALLNFCTQIPNVAFSTFLPLWAIARGVGNPGTLFVGSQVGAVVSRLLGGRMADRYGRRPVLVPVLVGLAATLAGMRCVAGLPFLFALAAGYGTLYGVAFVILPSLAGEAVPATGRGAAINTMGLGADLAQLLGPWGLGLAAGTWGFGGALVAAGMVPLAGAVVYLAQARRG